MDLRTPRMYLGLRILHLPEYAASLFKKVNKKLQAKKTMAALKHVARTKKMSAYNCTIDFFYCELFLDQSYCHRYYKGETRKKLRDRLSPEEVVERENFMLDCLELAEMLHERDLADDWDVKTDLYVWNMWHKKSTKGNRRARTWTAFRSMALHLKEHYATPGIH